MRLLCNRVRKWKHKKQVNLMSKTFDRTSFIFRVNSKFLFSYFGEKQRCELVRIWYLFLSFSVKAQTAQLIILPNILVFPHLRLSLRPKQSIMTTLIYVFADF